MASFWRFVDFGTTLKAFAVFSLFVTAPGYAAGWLSDAFGFRKGSALRQAALTVPLSIAVLPILVYLPWRFLSIRAVWIEMAAIVLVALVILARELREASRRPDAFPAQWRGPRRTAWIVGLTAVAVWLLVGIVSLLDVRSGDRLYRSVTVCDYCSRIPLVSAISHVDKLPPTNPFLTLRQPAQLRYHYFWPMVCGLVAATGHDAISARDATLAGALWAGIALICVIPVYLRLFQGLDPARWRPYAIGMALLGVTGLDILPVLQWDYHFRHTPALLSPTIESWNEQVTGWMNAMLWVPHNVAALVACLIAFLVLWRDSQPDLEEAGARRPRAGAVILAAVALASAAGMSVFVTFTFACILVVWALLELLRRHPRALAAVAAAGVLSLILVSPFALEMRSSTPGPLPIHWQVRQFYLMSYQQELSPLGLVGGEQSWTSTLSRLAVLPLNYFLELGVYLYVGILCLKRLWRNRPISGRDLAAVTMLSVSVILCTFLASDVGAAANDLGWRGFLPAQFILLVWAAELLDNHAHLRPKQYGWLILLLAIGASSTLLDLSLLRGFDRFIDSQWFNELGGMPNINHHLGERYAARADSYAWIRAHTPVDAVLEANPDPDRTYFHGIYAERPALAMGGDCGLYSGKLKECVDIKSAVRPLFNGTATLQNFPDVCRDFPVDLVVVTDSDLVWTKKDNWMQHYQPVYATEYTKVFACRPALLSARQ